MKKQYISPSIQVLQIVVDNILSGSAGADNSFPNMDGVPSEPGKDYYDDYEEESDGAVYSNVNPWGF